MRSRTEEQSERYRWGLDRFIREARTLARFDHPNIVRVLSVFEHNNTAYMVMRFEEGENLAALLERRRTLPEDELMRIVLPILDGLELVHNAGFIHRDIKPDNIHIRADGSPVLLDFGSARHSMGHARTVTILVAPGYAPFEQYYSSGENQGPWTDLYSLGATCYRAIAGIAPMDAITRSKGILGSTREILVPAVDHRQRALFGGPAQGDRPRAALRGEGAAAEHRGVAARARGRRHARGARGAGDHVGDAGDGAGARAPPAAAPAPSIRGPVIWATLGALVAAVVVVAVVFWLLPRAEDPNGKLARAHSQRSEAERREMEAQRQKDMDAAAQRQRDEQQKREADRRAESGAGEESSRTSGHAARRKRRRPPRRKRSARRRPRRRPTRQRAEARRQKSRAKRSGRASAAKRRVLRSRSTPPAPPPAPPKAAEPDLLTQAEQASKRGNDAESLALFRKAADAGQRRGAVRAGRDVCRGARRPQSNFQAYVWFASRGARRARRCEGAARAGHGHAAAGRNPAGGRNCCAEPAQPG